MRSDELILRIGLSVTYGAIAAVGVVALGLITRFEIAGVRLDIQDHPDYRYFILCVFLGICWLSYELQGSDNNTTSNRP